MPVRNIFEEGAQLPDPRETSDAREKAGEVDPVDQVARDYIKGQRLRAFREGAGLPGGAEASERGTATGTTKTEESTKLDVAAMFKAMTEQNTALMTQLTGLLRDRTDPQLAAWQKDMEHHTEEIKKEVQAGRLSPTAAMSEYMALEDQLAERMKKRLGLPEGFRPSGQDTASLLQLERMKIDHEQWLKVQDVKMGDENRRWEADREDRQYKATQEQKRWEAEFELRRQDLLDERRNKGRVTIAFEDLAGAAIEGISGKKGSMIRQTASAPEGEEQRRLTPRVFPCQECGKSIDVASPGLPEVKCPNCGKEYVLSPVEE